MEKIINIRDLGGIVTSLGHVIKHGKLFRSGNPGVASASDRNKLEQLLLEEVIDFRSDEEKRASEQIFAKSFNWVAQPVFVGDMSGLLAKYLTKEIACESMCNIYRRFPIEFQAQFRYLLKQAEQGKTLLYHCTAGKDRTGFATLLLLAALGVDLEVIMEDYLLSNHSTTALKQYMVNFMGVEAPEPEVLNAILEVYPDYLESALQVIEEKFGGLTKYITVCLGVNIDVIRQHYLLT